MTINDIQDLMQQHEQLKSDFGQFEDLVADENWQQALKAWDDFYIEVHQLILKEENGLYQLLDKSLNSNKTQSPFAILRIEHENLSQLIEELSRLIEKKQKGSILNAADNFMLFLNEHFARERNIISPLIPS
ncbi:MAG TPA: hemerythrin domain-containing protein [Aeromonadales bacterium]|nr:hemerythrin domain-containing protein [Aeromonadales bacterium]